MKKIIYILSITLWLGFLGTAFSAESPGDNKPSQTPPSDADILLDLFRKKGLISEQDVQEAQKALQQRRSQSTESAGSSLIKVNKAIKSLELFGDARLRYEWREGQSVYSDTLSRERYRYRLRFGAKAEFTDNFYGGIRLETSTSPRSSNVTFGDDGGGPWSKESDRINLGQLYLGWRPNEYFNIEAGRIANPIWSSILVWDSDLNPEGITERFKYSTEKVDYFATFAQFLYDDVNPENQFGWGAIRNDSFLLAWQLGAKVKFNKSTAFQIAPAVYNYAGLGDYDSIYDPATGKNTGIKDILVIDIPAEFSFSAAGLPWKVFGQVAINAKGSDRARAARIVNPLAYPGDSDENLAYQVGVAVGKPGKKGGWESRLFWQHTELFALDPNLVDSDIFDGMLNFEGICLSLAYYFTDNIFANITYGYGDRANKKLPTGQGLDLGDFGKTYTVNRYNLLQLDLNWKF